MTNYILCLMNEVSNENNMRLIFRPTTEQYQRIHELMDTGRYKTLSEILRQALNYGLDRIEKEELVRRDEIDSEEKENESRT